MGRVVTSTLPAGEVSPPAALSIAALARHLAPGRVERHRHQWCPLLGHRGLDHVAERRASGLLRSGGRAFRACGLEGGLALVTGPRVAEDVLGDMLDPPGHLRHLVDAPPFALSICQDDQQRALFLDAADRQLTGHRWHPDVSPERYEYIGRQRVFIATEVGAHARVLEARRVPAFPIGHESRNDGIRRVRIAVPDGTSARASGREGVGAHEVER
jgi:hypothetical protein